MFAVITLSLVLCHLSTDMAVEYYISVMFVLVVKTINNQAYTQYYMEDFCRKQISIEDSAAFLSLTKSMFYDHGYRCSMKLRVPENHIMSIQFTQFDVGQAHMIFCDDSLHVYDGENEDSDELTPLKGVCGTSLPETLLSSGTDLTLKFNSRYMSIGTGFDAIISVLQEDESVPCDKSLFKCADGYCIDRKLVCDGYFNCLTQRDESAKFADCQGVTGFWTDFSILMKVLCIAMLGLSVLTTAGLVLYFSKRRLTRHKRQH